MEQAGRNNKKDILIVEDDMLLSLVEERLVEKLGHRVVGKTVSGRDAVQKFHELQPDLILMDIILKGDMDGIEAMEKIREVSDVPVIYLSGNSDRYNYERARQTEFVDYLVKPVTGKELAEPLNKAFREARETGDVSGKIKDMKSSKKKIMNKSA